MKIKLLDLRRIIRETIAEQGWVPGRWYPGSGEPVSDDDIASMDQAGLGITHDEDDTDDEGQQ